MFLLPLNDTEPNRYTAVPMMTIALITANLLILGLEDLLFESDWTMLRSFIYLLGSIPQRSLLGSGGLNAISATFLHGGLGHLASNMIALWTFGRRVEDACGSWRFLLFYLTCGVLADITSTLVHAGSARPSIGASGAVFGVMGAYLLLYPGGRIRTLLVVVIIPTLPRIRAFWLILYFFIAQLLSVYEVLAFDLDYYVNYWAHLGGFFGSLAVFLFLHPEAFYRYRHNLPI